MLTGQLVFRNVSESDVCRPGYRVMMICGIVAIPDNRPFDMSIKGEHQYVVSGNDNIIRIHTDSEVDLTEKLRGVSLDGMIKSPIWRV